MNNILKKRLENNKRHKFQNCQTKTFLTLLDKSYENVLEVGCGKGFFSYVGAINKKFNNCFGCDVFNDYQVAEIKPFVKNTTYQDIKNDILPFQDNFFDLVFSMDVIEHVEDDINFIKEKIRVCKSGGEIIIGTPNLGRLTNRFLLAIGRLKYPKKMGEDSYGDVIHLREYNIEDLTDQIIKASDHLTVDDIEINSCWIGVMQVNFGFDNVPKIFQNLCQFWFVKFKKH